MNTPTGAPPFDPVDFGGGGGFQVGFQVGFSQVGRDPRARRVRHAAAQRRVEPHVRADMLDPAPTTGTLVGGAACAHRVSDGAEAADAFRDLRAACDRPRGQS